MNDETNKVQPRGFCQLPLNDEQVRFIRAAKGTMKLEDLAKAFERTTSAISSVQARRTYKHVKDDADVLPINMENVTLKEVWHKLNDVERRHILYALKRPEPALDGIQRLLNAWAAEVKPGITEDGE